MKNREKLLAAAAFLMAIATSFSNELSNLIGGESVRLTRHTVVVRKNITNAAGTFDIIDENTKKIDGVSSISDTKLPKNQAVIFDKIAVGYSLGTVDAGEEGIQDYGATTVPAELRNATLVITQNGREVLELPVADMVKGQQTNSPGDLYHDLEGFHYLVDDQPMEWRFRFPNGASIKPGGVGNDLNKYCEVRIQGFKTSRKQA